MEPEDEERCALCGAVGHYRFACPQRRQYLEAACAFVAARQRLASAWLPELPAALRARVAALVPRSSSAKVASRTLPDDPFFRPRPHRPGKRKGRKARQAAKQGAAAGAAGGGDKKAARAPVPDQPLTLLEFRTTLPPELASLLQQAWGGGSLRYESFCRCLSVPPSYTCLRVNTLRCPDIGEAQRQLDAALEPLREAYRSAGANEAADAEPLWQVARHSLLPDVLTVASAAAAADSAPQLPPPPSAAQAGDAGEGEGRYSRPASDPYLVVVGRLCGEAVLRGADVFCKGVLAASAGLHNGAHVQLWADLDNLVLRGSDVTQYEGRRVLLGWGVARMTRAEMFRAPRGLAVELRRRAPPATDAPSAPQHPSHAIRG